MGGGGEVQVTSIETRGQPDVGWLAATIDLYSVVCRFCSKADNPAGMICMK